ncbi:hypothetical protein [Sphingomonas nostoxanthinifaciens]|uniref:hypothetical protein n=1 Tax=Sphingomonas nostoxanthinifaciens TaxID=2872652 RepID=UPI001CC20B41|nr:hypothetical protein [Sphingomonas nostoxanthinifaciens]UAK24330.1 hypothetical protein K8P63_18790 [Sphingomonas nostoxanthinifaciens]
MRLQALKLAKQIMAARLIRKRHFTHGLFDEHAWDILLLLYIAGEEGQIVTVEEVAEFTETRLSSLDRWLIVLKAQSITVLSSWPHPHLELMPEAKTKMLSLLLETLSLQNDDHTGNLASELGLIPNEDRIGNS